MADETIHWFAGVDWGSAKHQVCLLDGAGNVVGEREFAHGGAGLAEVAPVWWTPTKLLREVSLLWPRPIPPMRRSFGGKWSSWCVPGVIRPIWLANSNPRPRRSATGLPRPTGRTGRREAKPAADAGLSAAEREELTRLRRENKQLRLERDILSRATAWFARETGVIPSGSSGS